jgi:hypothetical protein
MASLADLSSVFGTAPPAGFSLAGTAIQGGMTEAQTGFEREKILRDFNEFNLPSLINSQAARGAFRTSATQDKAKRLATGTQDSLTSLQLASNPAQAQLATNALLAQTGIRI